MKDRREISKVEVEMKKEQKAMAMQCFGKAVAAIELDPDPKAQDKLQEEYNCKNCDYYAFCCTLADTLKQDSTLEVRR